MNGKGKTDDIRTDLQKMLTFVEHSAVPAVGVRQNLDLKSERKKLKIDVNAERNIKNPKERCS